MTLEQLQAHVLGAIEQYQAAIRAANEAHESITLTTKAAAKQLSAEDIDKYGLWLMTTVVPLLNASNTQRTVC